MRIDVNKFLKFEESLQPLVKKATTKLIEFTKQQKFDKIVTLLEEEHPENIPASPRIYYHYSFKGGWVLHTRNVLKFVAQYFKTYKILLEQTSEIIPEQLPLQVNLNSLIKVALLHDVGKLGGYYTRSDWEGIARGRPYTTSSACPYITHSRLSVLMCSKYNIKLDYDELIAILLHDGPGLNENKDSFPNTHMLTQLLYQADNMALVLEQVQYDKFIANKIEYIFPEQSKQDKEIIIPTTKPIIKNEIIEPKPEEVSDEFEKLVKDLGTDIDF